MNFYLITKINKKSVKNSTKKINKCSKKINIKNPVASHKLTDKKKSPKKLHVIEQFTVQLNRPPSPQFVAFLSTSWLFSLRSTAFLITSHRHSIEKADNSRARLDKTINRVGKKINFRTHKRLRHETTTNRLIALLVFIFIACNWPWINEFDEFIALGRVGCFFCRIWWIFIFKCWIKKKLWWWRKNWKFMEIFKIKLKKNNQKNQNHLKIKI